MSEKPSIDPVVLRMVLIALLIALGANVQELAGLI